MLDRLADSPATAGGGGDERRGGADPWVGIADGDGVADAAHDGEVGPVVADEGDAVGGRFGAAAELVEGARLVGRTLDDEGDVQLSGPVLGDGHIPAGDNRRAATELLPQ